MDITRKLLACAFGGLAMSGPAQARVMFTFDLIDPYGTYSRYHSDVLANLAAAGNAWSSSLVGNAALAVSVAFNLSPNAIDRGTLATGGSELRAAGRTSGPYRVVESNAVLEIQHGVDFNGTGPDIQINLNQQLLARNRFFLAPPVPGLARAVPAQQFDLYTILLQELAHGLGFLSLRSSADGSVRDPSFGITPFDEHVAMRQNRLYFTGPQSVGAYGGWVPLYTGPDSSPDHLDVINDVMYWNLGLGVSRSISELDRAVLCDLGVPTTRCASAVSSPGSLSLVLGALALCGLGRRRV